MPSSIAISPEVNAYGQANPADEAEKIFKDKFTSMAYTAMASRFADLMPSVVTFKILETDMDKSAGLGTFILSYNEYPMYTPVVLRQGTLKPLEILYFKPLNMFIPMEMKWVDAVSQMDVANLGTGEKLPNGASKNVDLRGIVQPPHATGVGKFGSVNDEDVYNMFKQAFYQESPANATMFLDILTQAPVKVLDGIKLAFDSNTELLDAFTNNYGVNALASALHTGYKNTKLATTKVASIEPTETLEVYTANAPADILKEAFGKEAGIAYKLIRKHGYAVKDFRKTANVAVKLEGPSELVSLKNKAGWFKLFFTDKAPEDFLLLTVISSDSSSTSPISMDNRISATDIRDRNIIKLLINSAASKIYSFNNDELASVFGLPLIETPDCKLATTLLNKASSALKVTNGQTGCFVNFFNNAITCSPLLRDTQVSEYQNIRTIVSPNKYTNTDTYIIDKEAGNKRFLQVAQNYYVPKEAVFISIPKSSAPYGKNDMHTINSPDLIMKQLNNILVSAGIPSVRSKEAGANQWWIDNKTVAKSTALYKTAMQYDIAPLDAQNILENSHDSFYIMGKTAMPALMYTLNKFAGVEEVQGQGQTQQGTPMPAEPISPTDLAIGEAVQGLQQTQQQQMQQTQQQMQQMQQQLETQQQSTDQLIQTLQGIQQRSAELAQASNGQIPSNAMSSPAIAAQAIAPTPPPEPEPAPTPRMSTEDATASAEQIAQAINPEMVEQAQQFKDQGMFDTAAVGMLATTPILQDIVASYVPNLEKAIDNIGRILLSLWIKEDNLKENIGDDQYIKLEDNLRKLFKSLGDTTLELKQTTTDSDVNDLGPESVQGNV